MAVLHRMPNAVYAIRGNYYHLDELESFKIGDRRYRLKELVHTEIHTDIGKLISTYQPGFEFDGRSGPKIVDWYVPNLGNIFERIAWLNHDGCGYATCLDFESTNRLLRMFLRDQVGYSKIKSKLIETAVSLSKSWYGVPDENDTWYCNLGKFNLEWNDN